MEQLGQVFKRLREARHISLSEASGNEFSPSMLSKFESGKNEISAQKLFIALENTHTKVDEYLYL
ncbi:TPA: helix-turn-helix transcriptional regulator, partial [Streptococcus equi subsp. zooepidemicus]|nr:helix-turn-helix transcriptional regulator [Streptococcus equi subsp. zooepidemicus]